MNNQNKFVVEVFPSSPLLEAASPEDIDQVFDAIHTVPQSHCICYPVEQSDEVTQLKQKMKELYEAAQKLAMFREGTSQHRAAFDYIVQIAEDFQE